MADDLQLPVDDQQLRVWRLFLEAHAVVTDALERELRVEEDLPLAFYDVLVQLHEAPDRRHRMQDLAAAVLLSKSGLTRLVDRMQAEGLVERVRGDADRRVTWAVLTERGVRRLRETAPSHLRSVERHFLAHLDASALPTLAEALQAVVDAASPRGCADDHCD